ncbi:MAG TPA: BrnT family toxin [Acidobacteriota bacterium]
MRIDGFQWDENNVLKNILSHDTYPDEIEETFYNPYKLRKTLHDRYLFYGVTDSGRFLFIVFEFKKHAGKNLVRIISARTMTKREKGYYLSK